VSLAREIKSFLNQLDELDALSFASEQLAKLEAREERRALSLSDRFTSRFVRNAPIASSR
jgi:hypothetical protein